MGVGSERKKIEINLIQARRKVHKQRNEFMNNLWLTSETW